MRMVTFWSPQSEAVFESSHAKRVLMMEKQPPSPQQTYLDLPPLAPHPRSTISTSSSSSSVSSFKDLEASQVQNFRAFHLQQQQHHQQQANFPRQKSNSEFSPYYMEPDISVGFQTDPDSLYYRERSRSMGSCSLNQRQAYYNGFLSGINIGLSSRTDLVQINEKNDSNYLQSEVVLESTRRKLTQLMNENKNESGDDRRCHQSTSPHSFSGPILASRKYSEGNRGPYAKLARLHRNKMLEDLPVDLSVKRQRSYTNEMQYRLPHLRRVLIGESDKCEEINSHSILKSVLSGRGRSNSVSVPGTLLVGAALRANNTRSVRFSTKNQPVTLAKKNLLPITAHVTTWIEKMAQQAFKIEVFSNLTQNMQVLLLRSGVARILLLDMAETNFSFAVTVFQDPAPLSEGETALKECSVEEGQVATMAFVESVQNFILKCQALSIQEDEYACLKLMTLFRYNSSDNILPIEDVNLQARSTLNDLVRKSRPEDKLRYSSLLLLLHSLHCICAPMVETLFCAHLPCSLESLLRQLVAQHSLRLNL